MNLTNTDKARAVDRIAQKREGFTGFGEGYWDEAFDRYCRLFKEKPQDKFINLE